MKKKSQWIITITTAVFLSVFTIWRIAYERTKNPDNIPSLAVIQTQGEDFANEKLEGFTGDQIIEIWGEPDGKLSGFWADIWEFDDNGGAVILYYDPNGAVQTVKIKTDG